MKKRTSKLMCLALVCLLTVCMVVPAMAVSDSGTSVYGQYDYRWLIVRNVSDSRVTLTTPNTPATVGVVVRNQVYCVDHRVDGDAWSSGTTGENEMNPVTGYASVTGTANNVFRDSKGEMHTDDVQRTFGYFYINGRLVTGAKWV